MLRAMSADVEIVDLEQELQGNEYVTLQVRARKLGEVGARMRCAHAACMGA